MFLHMPVMGSSCMIMVGFHLHLVLLLSLDPCDVVFIADFDRVYEPGDSRSRSRHLSAPTHRPGPFASIKSRIFIIALPRSSKNHDFSSNWDKKRRGLLQIHFNDKMFWTFSRLVGPQEGLSIYVLWVEKSTCEVDHVFIVSLLYYYYPCIPVLIHCIQYPLSVKSI